MEGTLSRRESVVVGFFWISVVAVALMTVYEVATGKAARAEQEEHAEAGAEGVEDKIADLEAAVRANPGDVRSLIILGDAYLDSRRGYDALRIFLKVEAIAPDNVHVLKDLGTIYQQTGRLEDALVKFARVVELDPSQTGAQVHLALLYQNTGNLPRALEVLKAALATNSDPRYAEMIRAQIKKIESESESGSEPESEAESGGR